MGDFFSISELPNDFLRYEKMAPISECQLNIKTILRRKIKLNSLQESRKFHKFLKTYRISD